MKRGENHGSNNSGGGMRGAVMGDFPRIPGYRIVKKLGQGGMADVYEAVQENLDRKVAVKVIIPELFRDKSFSARFVKEAQTAAKLSHPHVLHVYDVGSTPKCNYIVMECLRGSLKDRLKSGPLSPGAALDIMRRMGEALDYAHAKGFVHRDIKPDNILFREDGTPVLADFGIAKALDSSTKLTRTGASVGTPHYMSPEQINGSDIDGRADFYSLGVVFYEMLIGTVPYEATDPLAICMKHLHEPIPVLPKPLSRYQPFLEKLLAKDPKERVGSGGELRVRIDNVIASPGKPFAKNKAPGPYADTGEADQNSRLQTQEYSSSDQAAVAGANRRLLPWSAGLLVLAALIAVIVWTRQNHQNGAGAVHPGMGADAAPLKHRATKIIPPGPDAPRKAMDREQLAAAVAGEKRPAEDQSRFEGNAGKTGAEKQLPAGGKKQNARTGTNNGADNMAIPELPRIALIDLDPRLAQEYDQTFQRIHVSGIPENVNVFGQISMLLSVDAAGGISLAFFDTQMLTVDPVDQQEQVRAIISGAVTQARLLPPRDRAGQAAILEKWRLVFKTSTLAGKITLLRQ